MRKALPQRNAGFATLPSWGRKARSGLVLVRAYEGTKDVKAAPHRLERVYSSLQELGLTKSPEFL